MKQSPSKTKDLKKKSCHIEYVPSSLKQISRTKDSKLTTIYIMNFVENFIRDIVLNVSLLHSGWPKAELQLNDPCGQKESCLKYSLSCYFKKILRIYLKEKAII